MSFSRRIGFAVIGMFLVASSTQTVFAQSQSTNKSVSSVNKPPDEKKSCKHFVQEFYNYYIPVAGGNGPTPEAALEAKKSHFGEDLYRQLKADFDASAKVKDEIVGLDFDPFVNSQDPAPKYVVGEVTERAGRFKVGVHGVSSDGKKNPQPDVTPELAHRNGKWVFLNFHYGKTSIPENENLISILKALAADRKKNPVK